MHRALFPLATLAFVAACEKKPAPPAEAASSATSTGADAPALASSSASPAGSGPAASAAPPAGAAAPAGPYNVLVISIDSLRADMPWAGYERPIAPRLTALYQKSVAYTRGYSVSSFTSKSVGAMVSGRYPSSLERTGRFFTKYLASNTFFAETCKEQGVPTLAGHAHAYFGAGLSGFEQGFDQWKLVPKITFDYNTDPYVTSDKLTPLAIEMLTTGSEAATAAGKPFFAWFHYMDPHDEYKEHAESPTFGKGRARDRYDQEVFYTDLWVGKLLDHVEAQPWGKKTVIIVTADHGEAFGEHGLYKHAHEVWEELVHVPLFAYVPGATPRAIDARRSHVDLVPTYLELLGLPKDDTLPGASLVGELFGAEAKERDVVVELPQDEYNERRRALYHGDHKLIAFGDDARFSLFDLARDPGEKTDLAKTEPDTMTRMKARYREVSQTIPYVAPQGGIPKR